MRHGLFMVKKQRIAIARALQNNLRFYFDEAVSNLDPHTADQFAQTVDNLECKVTIVFITHQLPKSLQVDEVIVLENNKI